MAVPDAIDCVECGGLARLTTAPPEDGWEVGDRIVYRCRDCADRFDLLVDAGDLDD